MHIHVHDCGLSAFCSLGTCVCWYIHAKRHDLFMHAVYGIPVCILSRRRRPVKVFKTREPVQYKPRADNQVSSQTTTGEFCCVSSHFLGLYL